jgi:Bifunctional DNA primase/polymerase, N-terminal/AAA domain
VNDADGDDPLAVAKAYATLGWRVAPVAPKSKHPIIDAWQDKATTDLDVIERWWGDAYVGAGVSIVTGPDSGLVVLDIDQHGEVSGVNTLDDLEETFGPLPDTPTVLTGGNGQHRYFRYPAGGEVIVNESAKRLGPGLDIRAVGGQVIAPPSLHASGRRYHWEASLRPAPATTLFAPAEGELPVAELPGWLLVMLTVAPTPERPERPPPDPDRNALPGDRWSAVTPWHELLEADGATYLGTRRRYGDGTTYEVWARPGVDHISATLGYGGADNLHVFSSNWPGLEENEHYTKFGYYTATRHGGDFAAARTALVREGFGDPALETLIAPPKDKPPPPQATDTPEALGLRSLQRLVDEPVEPYDWLVPGLLERGDRLIVTGAEGYGKSTLFRQVAVAAAAGHNPLAIPPYPTHHDPINVLLVDCENTHRQVRREAPRALGALSDVEAIGDRLWLALRTGGLVLDDPRDSLQHRAWLRACVGAVTTDLLLIGPLYKVLGGDPYGEQESRQLALFFDKLREDFDIAIAIEAHAPHGSKRPFGWSGWKRWPEFGFHLTEEGQFMAFRGARDGERCWPAALRRGGEGNWPWLPTEANTSEDGAPRDPVLDARVKVLNTLRSNGNRYMTANDLTERVATRRQVVLAAIRGLQDDDYLEVMTITKIRDNGRSVEVEAFRIKWGGPAGPRPD